MDSRDRLDLRLQKTKPRRHIREHHRNPHHRQDHADSGANRGLGKALVEEALKRGARRVYAASRRLLVHADERVVPIILDVTDREQIQRAAGSVDSLDMLINNAGVAR
jgi:hypothetical protein